MSELLEYLAGCRELELLKRLFLELQTSDDPRLAALREKIAGVHIQAARERLRVDRQYERAEQFRDDLLCNRTDNTLGTVAGLIFDLLTT